METNAQLEDILAADPFIFLQFRQYLEKKGRGWLLTFWLDAEFYRHIKKPKAKQLFAKQVYGKYVVPPALRERFTEEVTAEIELKIKGLLIDDDIFAAAQKKVSPSLLASYGRFRKSSVRAKLEQRKGPGSPTLSPKSSRRMSALKQTVQASTLTTSSAEQDEMLDYISKKMFNAHTGIILHDAKIRFKTLSHCFLGSEAIDWILRNVYFKNDRSKAQNFGQMIGDFGGGTFEVAGASTKIPKQPHILKDDPTIYRPVKVYQDKVVQVSNDEFAKQLDISSSEEAAEGPQEEEPAPTSAPPAQAAVPPIATATTSTTASKVGITVVEIPLHYLASPRRKDSISSVGRAASYTFGAAAGPKEGEVDVRRPYETLERLVISSYSPIIRALMTINYKKRELDGLARAIVYIFADSGADMMPVLGPLLAQAVATIDDPTLLFRSHDFVSSLVLSYAKLGAFEWFQDVLSPIIEAVGANTTFDFNDDGSVHRKFEARFCEVMDEVLDCLSSAVSDCPLHFRFLLSTFRSIVSSRFPENALSYTAGFFFLRIICPALVAPDDFGFLLAPMHPERHQLMVAISKTLQSCSNSLSDSAPRSPRSPRGHAATDKPSKGSSSPISQLTKVYKATVACFIDRLTLIPHISYPGALKVASGREVKQRAMHLFHSTILSKKELFLNALKQQDARLEEQIGPLLDSLVATPAAPELKRSASSISQRQGNSVENVLKL